MKVGNLVRFSAYGMKRGYNFYLCYKGSPVGLVVGIRKVGPWAPYYKVRWINQHNSVSEHDRRELKFAK